jgi:cell division protein FtsQ
MPSGDAVAGGGAARFRILSVRLKLALAGIVALALLTSPLWAPLVFRRMDFFHVRRVEIFGAHYVAPSDILARLHVDTTASVWDPTAPLVARVAGHPEIAHATVHRKLPGTLVVDVTERVPVALVRTNGGFRAYDDGGLPLPIDPARVMVDAPVLLDRDTTLLRLLGRMRAGMPDLYRRVSTARRTGRDEVVLNLNTVPVRAMQDVTLQQLAEVDPVEADLASKHTPVAEIDLRYRDQVIARLP